MREAVIEGYLIARVKALGGEIRKVHWGGRSKAPDRVVMLPPRDPRYNGETIWVEVKNPETINHFPANPHERAQHREHERMRAVGQTVLVIGTIEQIEKVFPL